MSQHADITKTVISKGIRYGLSASQVHTLLVEILGAAGYDDSYMIPFDEIFSIAEDYILAQKDGLYGVSHVEVREWISREILKK